MSPVQRNVASCVALVAWFALLLQLYLSIRQSVAMGRDVAHGVSMYFAFFTILTNLLAAIVLTVPLAAPQSRLARFCAHHGTIAGVAANVALVGIAYNLLLRGLWHPQGLQLVDDVLLHDALPIAFIGYSWLSAGVAVASFTVRAVWGVWPIAYFIYAMLRGALSGFYPYPFINVAHLGYGRVLVNAIGILIGYFVIAALLGFVERMRPRTARVRPLAPFAERGRSGAADSSEAG